MYDGRKIHILCAYEPKIGHFEIIAEFCVFVFFTVLLFYNFSFAKYL